MYITFLISPHFWLKNNFPPPRGTWNLLHLPWNLTCFIPECHWSWEHPAEVRMLTREQGWRDSWILDAYPETSDTSLPTHCSRQLHKKFHWHFSKVLARATSMAPQWLLCHSLSQGHALSNEVWISVWKGPFSGESISALGISSLLSLFLNCLGLPSFLLANPSL